MIKKIAFHLLNNVVVNRILIITKCDTKKTLPQWLTFTIDSKKSLQENNGFSHRPDVDETIARIKQDLQSIVRQQSASGAVSVLDFGCGTGLYLKSLDGLGAQLNGIDVSEQMCEQARQLNPMATIVTANYLDTGFHKKVSLIYSISVLEYVPRSRMREFFKKMHANLESDGLIYILYPHALSFKDTLYPNLRYIQYSPRIVERIASEYFRIVEHRHVWDNKSCCKWDKTPYQIQNGSIRNGFVLIGKKK